MVDTNLCKTRHDLEEAMRFESLRNKAIRLQASVESVTSAMTRLQSMKTRYESELAQCSKELEKLSDRPWIVWDTKG